MIGSTNAGLGMNETSVESKIQYYDSNTVQSIYVEGLRKFRGYPLINNLVSPAAWNTEYRLGELSGSQTIVLPIPDFTNQILGTSGSTTGVNIQTIEIRVIFTTGESVSGVSLEFTAPNGYNLIWPDEDLETLETNSIYEVSFAPLVTGTSPSYIIANCRQYSKPEQ